MSIALFPEPPRVTISVPSIADGSREGLLIGFTDDDGLEGILCLEDGGITRLPLGTFSFNYHYDAETDRWIDQNAPRPVQEG